MDPGNVFGGPHPVGGGGGTAYIFAAPRRETCITAPSVVKV